MLLELEVTGKCQLECVHCYAESGPGGTHGAMTAEEWRRVIDQAPETGVDRVQMIGGEPLLYPDLTELIDRALGAGLGVEVYSNLVHVPDRLWDVLVRPGVSLATSYYTTDPREHVRITGPNTLERTRADIATAVRREIPIRIGLVHVLDGQRTAEARAELERLGVTSIGEDRARKVGRAAGNGAPQDPSELCGRCGDTIFTVLPSGDVVPCGLGRWMTGGNVLQTPLPEILTGANWRRSVESIPRPRGGCDPGQKPCNPDEDSDDCRPSEEDCPPEKN